MNIPKLISMMVTFLLFATITIQNENWTETIAFRETDPNGLIDKDNATFNVSSVKYHLESRVIPDQDIARINALGLFNQPIIGQNDSIWVNVTKNIYPTVIHPCEPTTIGINVTVEGEPTIKLPVAVMLLIDVSGSMNWEYENETGDLHPALYYVKNAANIFIDQMDLANDTIGVASFARTATLDQELTQNGNAAKNAINNLSAGGYTNTGEGIRIAQQELSENCPSDAFPIILLFTDGLPTARGTGGQGCGNSCPTSNNSCSNYARNQANNSKDENTTIFSIGFTGAITQGCSNESVTFAKWLLKDIASSEEYYYDAPNATDIKEIYLNISQKIYDAAISNLVVSDYLPSHFIITNDGGGNYSVLPNGTHKIVFTRSFLSLNDSWNIEFKVTTHELGDMLLTNFANSNLTYTQDNTSYTAFLPYPRYINVTSPLEIEKNAPVLVNQGEQFNYSINITNIGHLTLNNVTLTDPLSNKVIFNSIDCNYSGFDEDNWNYNEHTLNITNIFVDIGDKIGFDISVTVLIVASGDINNTVYSGYSLSSNCTIENICNSSVTTRINDPPVITTDDDTDAIEDELYTVDYEATDDDGDTLTWSLETNATFLSIESDTGVLSGTPENADVGSYWVNVSVDDGNGGSDFTNFTLTVINMNDPPVITTDDDTNAIEDELYTVDYEATDDDGDTLTWSLETNTSFLSITTDAGVLSGTPVNADVGSYWVNVSVDDGNGGSDFSNFTLNVINVNDPPNTPSNPKPDDGATGLGLNPTLSVNVSDPDEDTMNVSFYNGDNDNLIGTAVSSNGTASITWPNRSYGTSYKWYAIANDSSLENISNTWSFTTKSKSSGPPNQSPTADANGPYFGFIEEEIEFDGSESTDDGTIVNYTWDFGDDTNGYGINPTHTYEEAGEYTVILTVTDDEGETDNDETTAFINQPNRSPTTPILNGTKDGTKNTEYTYTAVSTDLDNDTIQYTFDWGDNETDVSEFLANGTIFSITHNWTSYGIYTVGVYATDENNATSGVAEFIVLIDIHYCDNIGYLIDNNSNGFYDLFYCNETDNETFTKEENGTYLIDTDGDDKWDYAYNQDTGLTLYYHYVFDKYYTIYKETPGFELITLLAMIAIVLAIMRRRRK